MGAKLVAAGLAAQGPCDIFDAGKTPCVAAHSTVRALYDKYNGNLYQVLRTSDNTTKDIPTLTAGGFANSAVQDEFCKGTDCTINRLYDQSPRGNHLDLAPPGGYRHAPDTGVNATAEKLIVGGHPVYAAHFKPGNGYRNDKTSGISRGDEPETMYMVTSGRYFNEHCCFDYGNAETDNKDDGAGTLEAIYFGNSYGQLSHGGDGNGPWIMADMESALWGADRIASHEPSIKHNYVTAMIKGDVSTKVLGTATDYKKGVDYGGNNIAPCGESGCILHKDSTHLDCEKTCNATLSCIGYVFADSSCSGVSGPICWTKGTMESPMKESCRNSRKMGDVSSHWAIKGGDAQSGKLQVYWDGKRAPGYAPMKKQGAIILGIGGDNSAGAEGTFYEGVITQGYTSDVADDAVQANIVAVGYKDLSALNSLVV